MVIPDIKIHAEFKTLPISEKLNLLNYPEKITEVELPYYLHANFFIEVNGKTIRNQDLPIGDSNNVRMVV